MRISDWSSDVCSSDLKINDEVSRQKKASYYTDTIFVDGFAKSKEYEVTLHAISRANVNSDPVVVKVHPDTPSYLAAFPPLTVQADFGGIHVPTVNKESKRSEERHGGKEGV